MFAGFMAVCCAIGIVSGLYYIAAGIVKTNNDALYSAFDDSNSN
jgi:hypothetical protein